MGRGSNKILTYLLTIPLKGPCIRYACHLDCWDGVEESTNDGVNLFVKE